LSAIAALGWAWLFPARTARHTCRLPLWQASVAHLVATLAALTLIFVLVAMVESAAFAGDRSVSSCMARTASDIGRQYERDPWFFIAAALMAVAVVEAVFAALAGLIAPWGAKDERLRASYANALRQTWLHTGRLLPAVCLFGVILVPLVSARQEWDRAPVNAPPVYQQDPHEWQAQWAAWQRQRPWYIRYEPTFYVLGAPLLVSWLLWGLMRAIGAPRATDPIARPPTCETCGYNLTGASMDARCPECGDPVEASLGSGARLGPLWERRHDVGSWRAGWRCAIDAAVRPKSFGRQLQVTTPQTAHRRFLAIQFLPVFLLGAASGLHLLWMTNRTAFRTEPEAAITIGPMFGCLACAVFLALVFGAAGFAGFGYAHLDKRNLMNAAMQSAAYASTCLVAWFAFAASTFAAVIALAGTRGFRELTNSMRIDNMLAAVMIWLLPNVLLVIEYLWMVWRATGSARHANR